MIKKLKRRFIVLAMVSLTVLLSVIVAGMNVINYQKVVSDADARIEVLEENTDSTFDMMPFDDIEEFFFGPGGPGGPSMSKDEAEESRFFTVIVDEDGYATQINVDRISSVNELEAVSYARSALSSGEDEGFVGEFRFSVSDYRAGYRITFLDCGRVLESFRDFLKASIIMSLIGLALIFGVITYFAGRIVRPVA